MQAPTFAIAIEMMKFRLFQLQDQGLFEKDDITIRKMILPFVSYDGSDHEV
jgi:hypothetical protein